MTFPIAHFPDAHFPDAHFPHGEIAVHQGGGGGRKRKPFKSWDQRQREREAELKAHKEALAARQAEESMEQDGDDPPELEQALRASPQPKNKPLSTQAMQEYKARKMRYLSRKFDEETMALILRLL